MPRHESPLGFIPALPVISSARRGDHAHIAKAEVVASIGWRFSWPIMRF